MVSTLSLKDFQKSGKWLFQRLRTFAFYLKVYSKPFPEMLTMTNFGFEDFWTLCLAFAVSGFNFVFQKCARNWNHLLKCFLCPNLDLHSFVCSVLFSTKTVSTCSLKKYPKQIKTPFSNAQNILFSISR